MDSFKKAKVVRLRSQHQKYLTASEDEDSVKQSRNGSSKNARWTIEPIEGKPNVIRLKSCYSWKYLSASEEPFLLGWTGKRVFQSSPRLRLDSTVEWEPIKHGSGSLVKLMTRNGNFLRGNAGVPPWNNSVTHDVPSRNTTQDWILWNVDIIEVDYQSTDDVEDKNSVVEESIGCNVEDHIHGSFSSVTTMEEAKHSYQVGSPVSSSTPTSARSNSEVSGSTFFFYYYYFQRCALLLPLSKVYCALCIWEGQLSHVLQIHPHFTSSSKRLLLFISIISVLLH